MKNPEELEALQGVCSKLYSDRVEVEQDDTGRLMFTFYVQGEEEASMMLSPWGEAPVGNRPDERPELWRFELDGWEDERNIPIGTLCPHFIVGMVSY